MQKVFRKINDGVKSLMCCVCLCIMCVHAQTRLYRTCVFLEGMCLCVHVYLCMIAWSFEKLETFGGGGGGFVILCMTVVHR